MTYSMDSEKRDSARRNWSCLLMNKLKMQMSKQTDLILLDFIKEFDKVVLEKLILKIHQYGIRGDTLNWIKDFLDNREQTVVINDINSDEVPVSSGVPRGSVLGTILFTTSLHT